MNCQNSSASTTNTSAANIPFTEPRKGLVALSIATLDDGRGVEVGKSLFLTAGLKQRCFM
ncbi:hypothetical protein ALP12_101563 [Pseudomonas savastanoi pv. phaseolicola]|uniref:Uncharacterized protein n=1 Tax=Pseudomonas amygdali pv. mori TaxID=34065 RepID=A0A0P9UUR3_PSEA0|nr:hypothetical protein ALO63_101836 [Pseudomonas amygdali pv. mori]RMV30806.1 hypothetical protein ALP12_101563 [Pseudomonas savastanoi pv. phaseolicola]